MDRLHFWLPVPKVLVTSFATKSATLVYTTHLNTTKVEGSL